MTIFREMLIGIKKKKYDTLHKYLNSKEIQNIIIRNSKGRSMDITFKRNKTQTNILTRL